MIIVTGGAGFIGSNLIQALNQRGQTDILLVDNLANGRKMHNIADLDIADYLDKQEFLAALDRPDFLDKVTAVFHQGACSRHHGMGRPLCDGEQLRLFQTSVTRLRPAWHTVHLCLVRFGVRHGQAGLQRGSALRVSN